MNNQPLVSVIVVCYNAADYIIETLESIKEQTYKNIELIVSDDCSKDGTPALAQKWITDNNSSFVRTQLITVPNNTGVSANYNRAVKACQGIWIKNVDGDDLLTPNCIEDNLDYVQKHPESKWVFSNVRIFSGGPQKKYYGYFFDEDATRFFELEANEQYKSLLFSNKLPSQSCFISADLLQIHSYNELFKGLEDAPMWLTLTKEGIKACYFEKCTALYRKEESLTKSHSRYFSPYYFESYQKFFWFEKYDAIKELNLRDAYNYNRRFIFVMEFADAFLGNKRGFVKDLIYRLFRKYVNSKVSFTL